MNCWKTIETLRFCTGTPVTLRPSNQTSPELGGTSPAISCIRVVLPASVVPSRMLNPPDCELEARLVDVRLAADAPDDVLERERHDSGFRGGGTLDAADTDADGEPTGSPSVRLHADRSSPLSAWSSA